MGGSAGAGERSNRRVGQGGERQGGAEGRGRKGGGDTQLDDQGTATAEGGMEGVGDTKGEVEPKTGK